MIALSPGVRLALERDRAEIAWRAIASATLPEQRCVAVDVVANAFVDGLLGLETPSGELGLLAWVDGVCETYVAMPQIPMLLAGACRAAGAVLAAHDVPLGGFAATLSSIEASVTSVAFKLRRSHAVPGAALDEIDATIAVLVAQLEQSDPLSVEHSRAVSAWCARVARRLGLGEAEITFVARCGLVHDVGKMRVPTAILAAPRSLAASEWEIMKAHAADGEELVRAYKPLRQFAAVVRSHHERLDGKGYPDGLAASQLPLATRIVSVADCFNAMIGRRPYRLPMSPSSAMEQLHRHRGTQFDPVVVEAIFDVVSRADGRPPRESA